MVMLEQADLWQRGTRKSLQAVLPVGATSRLTLPVRMVAPAAGRGYPRRGVSVCAFAVEGVSSWT
jgi:hypothetical protein